MIDEPSKPIIFADQRQRRIYEKLSHLVGPGPSAFFKDACYLMNNPNTLENTSHFVAHCMREIESALRDVLRPIQEFSNSNLNSIDFSNRHKMEIQQILRALEIPENDETAKAWFELEGNLSRLAHRRALEPPRGLEEIQKFWENFQNLLYAVLPKIENKFSVYFLKLDELLVRRPTKENIKRFRNEIPNNLITRKYFFNRLENPEWVEPLWEHDFFKKPPQPIYEEKSIRFPEWPESKYLARMAKHKPELIAEIILKMEDTKNIAVVENLVVAALSMPPEISSKLVEKVKKWAEIPDFLLPRKIGELIAHWAKGNKIQEAMDVARILLDVLPGESENDFKEPRARFDTWNYSEILKRSFPELAKTAGLPALELLCDLLEKALKLSSFQDETGVDLSFLWRPAIEEHPQNYADTVEDALISALRDTAELLIKSNQSSVEKIIETLDQRKWKIFKRIALHTLRLFSDKARNLVITYLTNPNLFEDVHFEHEFALLLGENFPYLPKKEKEKILNWIEKGPKKLPSKKQKELWQYRRLCWIGPKNLPPKFQELHQKLSRKYGELIAPEFPVYSIEFVGSTSPKTADELKSMSVKEIVGLIKTLPPDQNLVPALSRVVVEEPKRFAKDAELFKNSPPRYISALISALEDALEQNKNFDWAPVLKLCYFVVRKAQRIYKQRSNMKEEIHNWRETCGIVALLLNTALEREGHIKIELRKELWKVLKLLTFDPDPTLEDEKQFSIDPIVLSYNSVRGRAIHAVISYALWIRKHLEKQPNSEEKLSKGFNEMPEVQEVLETHLDPTYDLSLAIRSIYGRRFPCLVLLDQNWANKCKNKIFPLNPEDKKFFDVAWDSYIISCKPYNNVFRLLYDVYSHAVNQIGQREAKFRYPINPEKALAEHLMAFYWRGEISLQDPLFVSFWEKASDPLKAHAIKFIGLALKRTEQPIPIEIIDRLQKLWEERLNEAKKSPPEHIGEISSFGWWVISNKFDKKWIIDNLLEALKLAGKIEPTYEVLQILAELSEIDLPKSLECLRLIAESDRYGWDITASTQAIQKILLSALNNPSTMKKARNVINYLLSRGFLEFKNLFQ